MINKLTYRFGSGCGSVGRAVASDARGLRFESSHRQTFISDIYLLTVNYIEKTKIKRKRGQELKLINVQIQGRLNKGYVLIKNERKVDELVCESSKRKGSKKRKRERLIQTFSQKCISAFWIYFSNTVRLVTRFVTSLVKLCYNRKACYSFTTCYRCKTCYSHKAGDSCKSANLNKTSRLIFWNLSAANHLAKVVQLKTVYLSRKVLTSGLTILCLN